VRGSGRKTWFVETEGPVIGKVVVGTADARSSASESAKCQQLTASSKEWKLPASIVRLCKENLMKEAKTRSKNELLPGTLEMLILKTLSIESMHGYGIAQHIQMLSADVLTIEEGSLYPALQRLLVKRWVLAKWKISANHRRARFYTLTAAGKKQLGVEESRFAEIFGAILRVMKTT